MTNQLQEEFEKAIAGLYFRSESDYPFELLDLGQLGTGAVTPQLLLAQLGLPENTPVREEEVAYFFRNMTRIRAEFDQASTREAERFQHLMSIIEQKLTQPKVYKLGAVQVDAYILGTTAEGHLAGLKTHVIET